MKPSCALERGCGYRSRPQLHWGDAVCQLQIFVTAEFCVSCCSFVLTHGGIQGYSEPEKRCKNCATRVISFSLGKRFVEDGAGSLTLASQR